MIYSFLDDDHYYLSQCDGPDVSRILSHPSQLQLISNCYSNHPVEICSINHFDFDRMADADYVLGQMMKLQDMPAEHGGFRRLGDAELNALYIGGADVLSMIPRPSPLAANALRAHPAILSGLTFAFGGVLTLQLITLLSYIFDIMRFVDPKHPSRMSKLRSFFKLAYPTPLLNFLQVQKADKFNVRPSMAFTAWFVHPYNELARDRLRSKPQAFLFRDAAEYTDQFSKHYNLDEAKNLALWKTTCRFIQFVKMMWTAGVSDKPFMPERFFKRDDEVEAFLSHLHNLDFPLDNIFAPI